MQNLKPAAKKLLNLSEFLGITISLVLLPIDRFPYLHYVPLHLGFVSLILLIMAALGRLYSVWRSNRHRDFKRYILIGAALALPVVAYGQSIFYAIDHPYALGATKLLAAVALRAFCFFVLVSETPQLWRLIKKTIYITTAVVVAFAFFQFFFDVFGASPKITDLRPCCTSNHSTYVFPRVHSTSIEPLYFANYLLIPIWLLSLDFLRSERLRRSRLHLLLFGASATIVFLTLSRGAILAFLISGLVFALGLPKPKRQARPFWRKKIKLWVLSLAASLALILMASIASQFIHKQAINGSHSGAGNVQIFSSHAVNVVDDSAKTRYTLWPKALTYIKEKPIQGVGAYNSRIRLNIDQYKQGVNPKALQPFNNDLIGLLVDLGLIGIIAFAPLIYGVFAAILRLFRSSWEGEAAAMAMIMIGMLVQSNFFHSILLSRLWIVAGLLLTVLSPKRTTNQQAKKAT